ncbi:MAG: YebC/PmpR family DNA-binding transcriptional regulator [Candidatus Portnoybacteria bacterium CG10_big_fil_rev_8_21_14_0_10_38_18]|uniref:YebC/PmpR family DNA-binding transcriptional regulator n=1 Tax=Candidatus Portnoybacteria bacterium CG10_big_fil_rev_8_21_14_0_10_38_18 TaxID=1974813 RepID=A0A2M8KCK1_9BACT|nr:MAG: YebC/PmpR family DNA-binding transcriptional regulator [Candidatus Portnoybacteria bacterium CG10_big_fil_rev_8_21_14_0_10_38_18]
MSGHSHWAGIKHKKELTDKKRGQIFSKMAKMIEIAARKGGDAEMNPGLRLVIEKARLVNMPNDNIERAIKKGTGENREGQLEEITYEAYGPNGTPLIIEVITDNKNRALSEIKHILNTYGGKLAESGSVRYLFERMEGEWKPKYSVDVADENLKQQLEKLFDALDENDDVNEIYSNVNL